MLFIIVILWTIMIASLILGYLLFINRDRILVRQRLIACTIKEEKAYLPPELQLGFKTRVVNRVMASFTQVFKRLIPNNEKDAYNMKLLSGKPNLNGNYLVIDTDFC